MQKSAELCIMENDLDTAFKRYQNTNKRWKGHWFETCLTIFNKSQKWAAKYTIDIVNKVITKIKVATSSDRIIWNTEKLTYEKGSELCYLVELLGKNGNLIATKIGTTTRTIEGRMKEHLRYYAKDGVETIRINRVWDCGKVEAEGFESYFRAIAIKNFPKTWKKNDRFMKVAISTDYADELFNQYQEI